MLVTTQQMLRRVREDLRAQAETEIVLGEARRCQAGGIPADLKAPLVQVSILLDQFAVDYIAAIQERAL